MHIKTVTTKTVIFDHHDVKKAVIEWVRVRWGTEIKDPNALAIIGQASPLPAFHVTYEVKQKE